MDTPKKPADAVTVVGSNVLILAFYTVVFKAIPDQGGLYLDAFLIITQFIICMAIANGVKNKVWLLSAALVLIIGFSTCTLL